MTQPGILRHSRSHREAVKRIDARTLWHYQVTGPHIRRQPATLPPLPDGARVLERLEVDYGTATRWRIVAPKGGRFMVPGGWEVKDLGRWNGNPPPASDRRATRIPPVEYRRFDATERAARDWQPR